MELERFFRERRELVERALERHLPPSEAHPPRIHQAIRHAVLSGGKRLRPLLALATTELLGERAEDVLPAAAALELIHASTLVLDDLPSMDNAELRRGQPTTHRAFGESTAILAAVALLVHAFDLIAENANALGARRERIARVVHEAALATGTLGLVGGQFQDLEVVERAVDVRTLEYIHSHKTGQLFVLSATLGPLLLGAEEADVDALRRYAKNLGLAFQIRDDLLDREPSSKTGKDSDQDRGRTTFASLVTRGQAERLIAELVATAQGWVGSFGVRARLLEEFAEQVVASGA